MKFLFEDETEAKTFARSVDEFYGKHPEDQSYFVIDDNGNRVLDENSRPIIAWMPQCDVRPFEESEDSDVEVFESANHVMDSTG